MAANPFDTTSYDDCGFDISHNNGTLDFNRLGSAGIGGGGRKYCILKITEGTSFTDPDFLTYVHGLVLSPIKRYGVYHFGHHGNPIGQMQYFIDAFTAAKKAMRNFISTPPNFTFMLDLERSANPPNETDGLAMVQYLQAIGINPMIYCGYDFWSQNWPALDQCSCFLAAYNRNPTSPIPWRIPSASVYGWDIWQYTGDRLGPYAKNIPGGSTGMDLSCFNLLKHSQGVESWWDDIVAATKQPV